MGSPNIPEPKMPKPAPKRIDPEVLNARRAWRRRIAQWRGRASTILTGPSGVGGPSSGSRRTLGGS